MPRITLTTRECVYVDVLLDHLTFGGSAHPAFTDTMCGHTFFCDSHPPDAALELLCVAGFQPRVSDFVDLPTGGRDTGRYAVVARMR